MLKMVTRLKWGHPQRILARKRQSESKDLRFALLQTRQTQRPSLFDNAEDQTERTITDEGRAFSVTP